MTDHPSLPTSAEILAFIEQNRGEVTQRELTRGLKISADNRGHFRRLISQLCEEGHLQTFRNKVSRLPLPKILVVSVSEIDEKGNVLARPDARHLTGRIHVLGDENSYHRIGDRLKVRISEKLADHTYTAKIIESMNAQTTRITGVFNASKQGHFIEPTERGWPPRIPVERNNHQPKSQHLHKPD